MAVKIRENERREREMLYEIAYGNKCFNARERQCSAES